MKKVKYIFLIICVIAAGLWIARRLYQDRVYEQIISRLQAESRAAEVLVTNVGFDELTHRNLTTIKFVEYDTQNHPLEAKYFTFSGNVIQFQSLVVRFDDKFVAAGDRFKGKSVYLFWKAFTLEGAQTKEFPISVVDEVPGGYKIEKRVNNYENKFWKEFWRFAFDAQMAHKAGVKSVQIEAPGAVFIPGYLYTINIEHDGGLRIDTKALPSILRGEKIPS